MGPVRFLINPTAGGGHAGRVQARVTERAEAVGASVEISESARDLIARAARAVEEGCARLVVVGGDGTVHLAVQALARTDCELAVIATGRGDDFANALGIATDLDGALQMALEGESRSIDLLKITGIAGGVKPRPYVPDTRLGNGVGAGLAPARPDAVWGCLYASFGFDSLVTYTANAQARWVPRSATYILAALRALVGFEASTIGVEHDGGRLEELLMFATVCNSPLYGGGMKIAPEARMDDGILDLVTVRRIAKPTLLRIFPSVWEGRHLEHPAVSLFSTPWARITASPPVLIGCDGEIEGEVGAEPVEVTVERRALRVVAPPTA